MTETQDRQVERLDYRERPNGPVGSRGTRQHQGDGPPRSAVLPAAAAGLPAATLDQVLQVAGLLTRVDRKYLVPVDVVESLVHGLGERHHVLEMEGIRAFAYESVYFDTPDLALYRHHVQGRRRRFKVRTRSYVDTLACMLEVKLKGSRGETVKCRREHPFDERGALPATAQAYLSEVLDAYGLTAPGPLIPRLTTTYRRTTLVDLRAGARVTLDEGLVCREGVRAVDGRSHVIVESKSGDGRSEADATLLSLGVRPVRISKYCAGVALLHPELPANPWSRTLRRHYGYRRAPEGP